MSEVKSLKEILFEFRQKQKIGIPIILDDKVDEFIKWYIDTFVQGKYTAIGEFTKPKELRNLIEKMAVWYELRYPDFEIEKIFNGNNSSLQASNIMFNQNGYINEQLDENAETRALDWDRFYNADVFFASLNNNEKYFFSEASYGDILYVNPLYRSAHVHLNADGTVEMSEHMNQYSNWTIADEELEGMHIRDVIAFLEQKGVTLPSNSEFLSSIEYVDNRIYLKEELLNCVMYRIIERGGNRIGPCRGLLFAKEFARNVDAPMTYGVDLSDPNLRGFIIEYIKAGGSPDLLCYVDYFYREQPYERLDTQAVGELLETVPNSSDSFYMPEENDLHQRLVNAIAYKAHKKSRKWAKRKVKD